MTDWSPWRAGRPRVYVDRRVADYPAPNPLPTACRLWQGAVDRYGYGTLSGRGKGVSNNHHVKIKAHRWIWEMAFGPIPEGKVVRHLCDNRLCFRISHLTLGTVAENNRDAKEHQHLGPVRALSPSEVDEIINLRATGLTWKQIHARYPFVGLTTVRRAGQFGHGPRPEKPPPEPSKYAAWREKGPT